MFAIFNRSLVSAGAGLAVSLIALLAFSGVAQAQTLSVDCQPGSSTVAVGSPILLTAVFSGTTTATSNLEINWATADEIETDAGSTFVFTPDTAGTHTVFVASSGASDSCIVTATATGTPGLPDTGAGGTARTIAMIAAGLTGLILAGSAAVYARSQLRDRRTSP